MSTYHRLEGAQVPNKTEEGPQELTFYGEDRKQAWADKQGNFRLWFRPGDEWDAEMEGTGTPPLGQVVGKASERRLNLSSEGKQEVVSRVKVWGLGLGYIISCNPHNRPRYNYSSSIDNETEAATP